MMLTLSAFISQTFKESIRNKIMYGIGFFAVAIFLFSLVLGELSLYEQARVIRDVCMTFLMVMGIALGMYTGIGLIHKEIDRRIIYTILSKPIRRYWHLVHAVCRACGHVSGRSWIARRSQRRYRCDIVPGILADLFAVHYCCGCGSDVFDVFKCHAVDADDIRICDFVIAESSDWDLCGAVQDARSPCSHARSPVFAAEFRAL